MKTVVCLSCGTQVRLVNKKLSEHNNRKGHKCPGSNTDNRKQYYPIEKNPEWPVVES